MAKKQVTKIKVQDRLFELKDKIQHKTVRPERIGRIARVLDAVKEGKPVKVIKPHMGAGVQYEIGDIFNYKDVPLSKISQLADHNFIEAGSEVSAYQEFLAIRSFYERTVQPVESRFIAARTEAQQAAQQVAVALAAVRDAENVQRDKLAFMGQLEDELAELLTGPEADHLQ